MKSKIIAGGGTFEVNIEDDNVTVIGYEGNESSIVLADDAISGKKIVAIGKKAFLGVKSIKRISLPGTVQRIDDWAFSGCSHLKSITVRDEKNVVFGKGVFDNCEELENVLIGYNEPDDISLLLGAAVWRLPAPYLFMDPDIGSSNWINSWDMALNNFLNSKDDEGYTDRVLCGEEDISYDGIGSVDGELLSDGINYLVETRKRKCYLCFLRLKASDGLSYEKREAFIAYLKNHGKGMEGEEAWEVLKDDLKGRIEYLKLYADIGGIEIDRIDDMLASLGEDYAEGKAFLIKYKQDNNNSKDYFQGLML